MSFNSKAERFPFFNLGQAVLKSLAGLKLQHWKDNGGEEGRKVPSLIFQVRQAVKNAVYDEVEFDLGQQLGYCLYTVDRLRGHAHEDICIEKHATPNAKSVGFRFNKNRVNERYTNLRDFQVSEHVKDLMAVLLLIRQYAPALLDAHPVITHLANEFTLTPAMYSQLLDANANYLLRQDNFYASANLQVHEGTQLKTRIISATITPSADNADWPFNKARIVNLRIGLLANIKQQGKYGLETVDVRLPDFVYSPGSIVLNPCAIADLASQVVEVFKAAAAYVPDICDHSQLSPSSVPQEIKQSYNYAVGGSLAKELDKLETKRNALTAELENLNRQINTLSAQVQDVKRITV